MRPWPALAALLALPGCAQLLGADDPVAAHPVPDAIAGQFLLGIDLHTSAAVAGVIQMKVPVTVDSDLRLIDIAPIALDFTSRANRGTLGDFFGDIDNTDQLDFSIEWAVDVPGPATHDGVPVSWTGNLHGHFPIPNGQTVATSDAFCGTIDGTITAPTDAQIQTTTFAAVRIEAGQLPPPPAAVRCADLPF